MATADQHRHPQPEAALDTYDFLTDPRSLSLKQRRASRARLQRDHDFWLDRVRALAEAPLPDDEFPAFLLATAPFHELAARLLPATRRAQLAPATADELDWFLAAFRDYLRTCEGEDVFTASHPVTPWR